MLKACFPDAFVAPCDGPFVDCDSGRASATCPAAIRRLFPDPSAVKELYVENQCRHPEFQNQVYLGFNGPNSKEIGRMVVQNGCVKATAKHSRSAVDEKVCSIADEDCSHTGCCRDGRLKCYKRDSFFASCLPTCHKSQGWSCDVINETSPDCAEDREDCIHLGCCKTRDRKCFMKNPGEAYCRTSAPHDWLGHEIIAKHFRGDGAQEPTPPPQPQPRPRPSPSPPAPRPTTTAEPDSGLPVGPGDHDEDMSQKWQGGMKGTHYWDCSGQGCDAAFLQPWDKSKYVSPPQYAPMNPHDHGGPIYGEHIWMTGAASDAVSSILGPDVNNCGADNGGGGGCGQCLLVKTAQSNHPDWLVVVMKKNRCPPHTAGCGGGEFHMDFGVPGFDNLQYSTANICGNPHTTLSRDQSAICGYAPPMHCNCGGIPTHTPALKRMRDGCELFKSWGWHSGTPMLDWRPVPCPHHFVEQVKIGAAFGPKGPIMQLFETGHGGNATALGAGNGGAGGGPDQLLVRTMRRWPWAAAAMLAGTVALTAVLGLGRRLQATRRRGMFPAGDETLVGCDQELAE